MSIQLSRENSSASLRSGILSPATSMSGAKTPKTPKTPVTPTPTPHEVTDAIEQTKAMAASLRDSARDTKKLEKIKGNEELMHRIDEVLVEIEQQSSKIVAAIKINKSVLHDLTMLNDVMQEIVEFFAAVQKAFMFMSKSRLKLRMQNLYQSLRSRLTQVMAAVSLALLTDKPAKEAPTPTVSSEIYRLGLSYYYGLHGKPLNYTFAFEKFVQAAEYGEEEAMIMTARCYLRGEGIEEHYDSAVNWLGRAAASGKCPHAKTEIAQLILQQIKSENPTAILDALTSNSNGNTDHNSRKNSRTSAKHSTKSTHNSASFGATVAGVTMSTSSMTSVNRALLRQSLRSLYTSDGAEADEDEDEDDGADDDEQQRESHSRQRRLWKEEEQDVQQAMALLLEAANEGHVEAKTQLGLVYEEAGDVEQAAKWYSLASNGGSAQATCHLAQLFLQGRDGLYMHRPKAFSLFSMAAKNGAVSSACNGIGLCYEGGVGVDQRVDLAVTWYRRGAERGDKQAMYNLGYVLVKSAIELLDNMHKVRAIAQHISSSHTPSLQPTDGEGEERDVEGEAEDEEVPRAGIYKDMSSRTVQTLKEGIHWLRAAADYDVSDASFQLGRLYEQAIGVPFDQHTALEHYTKAAEAGHAKAALYAANLLYAYNSPTATSTADGEASTTSFHGNFSGNINRPHSSATTYLTYDKAVAKAAQFYRQAAEAGIAEAMNAYALLLEDGRASADPLGAKDPLGAAAYYYAACQAQYADAFLNLALMLATDPVPAFTTLQGEVVTLSQITRFLERHLPHAQFDGEKRDMFQNLLEQAHNHHSQHNTSRGRQRVGGQDEEDDEDEEKEEESRKSNFKQPPQHQHQRQRSFEESKQQPRSSTRTSSSSSPARDIYHFNRHDPDVSTSVLLDATSDPSHADRHNTGHEVVAHIAALQRGSFQHKQQHQQEMQRQLQPPQQQQQLPPRAKSSSAHTSSAPPLPPQLQLQRVHSHSLEGVPHGSGDGGHGLYVTNGAIPPPNYVPRAALQTTLVAANKPSAKHNRAQSLDSSNAIQTGAHNSSALNSSAINSSALKSNNARYNHSSVQDSTSFPTPSPSPSLSTKGGAGKVVVQRSVSFNSSDGSFVSEYSTLKSSKVPPEPAKKSAASSMWQRMMRGSKNLNSSQQPHEEAAGSRQSSPRREDSRLGVSTSVPSLK